MRADTSVRTTMRPSCITVDGGPRFQARIERGRLAVLVPRHTSRIRQVTRNDSETRDRHSVHRPSPSVRGGSKEMSRTACEKSSTWMPRDDLLGAGCHTMIAAHASVCPREPEP